MNKLIIFLFLSIPSFCWGESTRIPLDGGLTTLTLKAEEMKVLYAISVGNLTHPVAIRVTGSKDLKISKRSSPPMFLSV